MACRVCRDKKVKCQFCIQLLISHFYDSNLDTFTSVGDSIHPTCTYCKARFFAPGFTTSHVIDDVLGSRHNL